MNSLILLPLCFAACMASVFPVGLHKQYVHHEHLVAPVVHKTAHVARSQYHSQDNFGQYSYGYAEPNGAKKETRHADGTVVGSYSVFLRPSDEDLVVANPGGNVFILYSDVSAYSCLLVHVEEGNIEWHFEMKAQKYMLHLLLEENHRHQQ
ncbi:unnamed protein product [Notodromas monacha]|uniref:Uncharacterized protein n=1 Tax=Notodromas monacha TaxID=399045 RepID=A0A7R9BZC6_9CRUS|nr:unnamed protein product [Notodromas monacha]CAG0924470.1 unnamed protein product [Notodromas monacha]